MNNNIQRLGRILADRMVLTSNAAVPLTVELGVINDNLTLTTDSIPAEIPKGDYMKPKGQSLNAGDRVLVVWCQNEPVIAAVVVSS